MNKQELEKMFLSSFTITNELQLYNAYPCNITEFQKECIIQNIFETIIPEVLKSILKDKTDSANIYGKVIGIDKFKQNAQELYGITL